MENAARPTGMVSSGVIDTPLVVHQEELVLPHHLTPAHHPDNTSRAKVMRSTMKYILLKKSRQLPVDVTAI